MACRGSECKTEHDFVALIVRDDRAPHDCCGPLVRLGFSAMQLCVIEESFQSAAADDLLWAGFDPEPIEAMYFVLCALHWMELACLVSMRGHQHAKPGWHTNGSELLSRVCGTQSWDPKEIANAFTWQRVRLT